jgi:hypothetical protein
MVSCSSQFLQTATIKTNTIKQCTQIRTAARNNNSVP